MTRRLFSKQHLISATPKDLAAKTISISHSLPTPLMKTFGAVCKPIEPTEIYKTLGNLIK